VGPFFSLLQLKQLKSVQAFCCPLELDIASLWRMGHTIKITYILDVSRALIWRSVLKLMLQLNKLKLHIS
jgi:hypothetical protein